MPRGPVPAEVSAFLAEPNLAIIATLRPDGAPHTATTWFAWDGERILLSMDESRLRLRFIRNDPRVSLTIPDSGFTVPQAAHRPRSARKLSIGMFSTQRSWCPQCPQRERGTSKLKVGCCGSGRSDKAAQSFSQARSIITGRR